MVRASVLAGVVRSKDERERERESIEVGIHISRIFVYNAALNMDDTSHRTKKRLKQR